MIHALLLSTILCCNLPEYFQDITVNIDCGSSEGSGVIKRCNDDIYIVTVAHIVENLRIERRKYKEQRMSQAFYSNNLGFRDAIIIKEIYFNGLSVGRLFLTAKVVRYSDYEDLAILRVVNECPFVKISAVFASPKYRYLVGSSLWHCGCFYGSQGINSISGGFISYLGRGRIKKRDQFTSYVAPGSSGGGVYDEKGMCLGLVVSRNEPGYNYFIPMRQIYPWAQRVGMEFVFNDDIPIPSRKEIRKWPVEDESNGDLLDLILRTLD